LYIDCFLSDLDLVADYVTELEFTSKRKLSLMLGILVSDCAYFLENRRILASCKIVFLVLDIFRLTNVFERL